MRNQTGVGLRDNLVGNYGIVFVLLALVVVLSLFAPSFLSVATLVNISRQIATIGICAVGMTIVMVSGGIDLSIGALMAVVNIVCAKLIVENGVHPVPAVLACIVVAAAVGALNAFWITIVKIPPLIATLGTMTSLRGLAYTLSGGRSVWGLGDGFGVLGRGQLGIVPIPFAIMAVMFVLGWFFLLHTRYGRFVYGMGGNEAAARRAGISVRKMKFLVYIVCSVITAIAGILLLSRLNTGLPKTGSGLEMEVVTAVVLGGVSIYGGKGSILGVFFGVVIMGVLTNGMTYLNITEYLQLVIRGFVLLVAIGFGHLSRKNRLT